MQGEVKKVPANNAKDIKDQFFAGYEGYEVDEHETHIYHIAMEARLFSQATGEKLSKPRVQKFDIDNYKRMKEGNGFNGFSIHILHNPEGKKSEAPKKIELTEINGVGEAKAELLKGAGIGSVKQLATLTPVQVEDLGKAVDGLSSEELNDWIEQAKKLLS